MSLNEIPAQYQAFMTIATVLGLLTGVICFGVALWHTIQAKFSSDEKVRSGANNHLKSFVATVGYIGFGIFLLTDLISLVVNHTGLIMTVVNFITSLINTGIDLFNNSVNVNQ